MFVFKVFIISRTKKIYRLGAEEIARWLKAPTALTEDLRLVPSAHVRQLTMDPTLALGDAALSLGFCGPHRQTRARVRTHAHTPLEKIEIMKIKTNIHEMESKKW